MEKRKKKHLEKVESLHKSNSMKNIKSNNYKKSLNSETNNDFTKVSGLGFTNTTGPQPIIIYKKQTKKSNNYIKPIKLSGENNNIYVSDGGLKKKLEKYNNCHNESMPNKNHKGSKNKKKNYLGEKPKILKSSGTQEKLFSRTMVDSFKRPNIPKKLNNTIKNNRSTITNSINVNESHKNKSPNLVRQQNRNGENKRHQKKTLSEGMSNEENEKIERMNQLVENAVVYELRKIQTDKKPIGLKEKISFRKKGYLEENGYETSFNFIEEPEKENENENENNFIIKENAEKGEEKETQAKAIKKKVKTEISSNPNINNSAYNNNNLNSNCIYLNNFINTNFDSQQSIEINKKKRKLKPKVNQFEFLEKIQEEQKKLPFHMELSNNYKNNFPKKNISFPKLNDSFRHDNTNIKKNKIKDGDKKKENNSPMKNNYFYGEKNNKQKNTDDKIKKEITKNNKEYSIETDNDSNEFPFANKKNYRTIEELINFEKKKKIKAKKEEQNKEYEKNRKLFVIFKNLYNLELKDNSEINTVSSTKKNYYNKKNNSKHKEPNEYYVGTESSRNCSTLIDLNEYYLNVLESQQLLVNSCLNKIDNLTEQLEIKENNNNNQINSNDNCLYNNNYSYSANNQIYINNGYEYNSNFNNINIINNESINIYNNGKSTQYSIDKNEVLNGNDIISKSNELNDKNLNSTKEKNNISGTSSNKKPKEDIIPNKKNKININNNNNYDKYKNKEKDKIGTSSLTKQKTKEIKIESSDICNNNFENNIKGFCSNSGINTKEKNLPSLTHTFSNNSNPNKKVEIEIQPCTVLNLVEIIKQLIQRKTFFKLYQIYLHKALSQRYTIAFAYFVAICKQFQFRKIEDYCNYKTYYYAFRQLFRPFTRRNFRLFINNCYIVTKVEYFVELLSRMFKFKAMERVYLFSQYEEENEQLKTICIIILKIILTLVKPHLKEAFFKLYNSLNILNDKIKPKDDDDSGQDNRIPDGEINQYETSPLHKKIDSSFKMNSFLYESIDSKSSYSVHPNSLDNDILHQLQNYLAENNNMMLFDNGYKNNPLYEEDRSIKSQISQKSIESLDFPGKNSSKEFDKKINNLKNQNSLPNEQKTLEESKKNIQQSGKNKNIKKLESEKTTNENEKTTKNDINENEEHKNEIVNKNKDNKGDNSTNKNKKRDINKLKIDIPKEEDIKKSLINDNVLSKNKENDLNENNNSSSNSNTGNINEKKDKKIKIEKLKIIDANKKSDNQNKDVEENNKKDNLENIKNEENKSDSSLKNILEKKEYIKRDKENKDTQNEPDISVDKENANSIDWDYNLSSNISPHSNKKEADKKDNKNNNKDKEKQKKITQNDNQVNNNINDNNIKNENGKNNEEKNKKKDKSNSSEDLYIEDFENDMQLDKENNHIHKNNKKNNNLENNGNDSSPKENIISFIKNEKNNSDKSRNTGANAANNIQQNEKNQIINQPNSERNHKENNIIDINELDVEILKKEPEKIFSKKNIDNLVEEIIKIILKSEVQSSRNKLIPNKKFKYDSPNNNNFLLNNSLNNSIGSLHDVGSREVSVGNLSLISLRDNGLQNLNDSIMSSYSASSVFNKSIKDKKKKQSLNLYLDKIAPLLLESVRKEIYDKYPRIYSYISKPLKNNAEGIMVSLELQSDEMIKDYYKKSCITEDINDIIDKEKVLKQFEPINRKIRSKVNIIDDNYYDNMLNECIIDTAIELIKRERLYGDDGEPFPWSSRTHELIFKYEKNNPKRLADFVIKNIEKFLKTKLGLIDKNYDYLTPDQIKVEKEKRLANNIKEEIEKFDSNWNNFEMEETQIKIEITEIIMEQLYNEVMEILEHIVLSRKSPELYQYKSIFGCEEIPKLSFQRTITENKDFVGSGEDEEDNDIINIQ